MIYKFHVKYKSGREETLRVEGGVRAKKTKDDLSKATEIGVLSFKEEVFETREIEKKKNLQSYVSSKSYKKVKDIAKKEGKSCSKVISDLIKESFE